MTERKSKPISFEEREFRGSRFRCLLLTHQAKPCVVALFNSLVRPFAIVSEDDRFMPEGFCNPGEARLGETPGFLSDEHRHIVTDWWLANLDRAETPNWDLVSTCTIEGRRGLVLVEAKAHVGELKPNDQCGARDANNREKIKGAVEDVSSKLGVGWSLSLNSHYQLSNRFTWARKVASLGVPVVLVYLGFLNAEEMPRPFKDHEAWDRCLRSYAEGIVPSTIWNSASIQVNGTPVVPLIRSINVNTAIT